MSRVCDPVPASHIEIATKNNSMGDRRRRRASNPPTQCLVLGSAMVYLSIIAAILLAITLLYIAVIFLLPGALLRRVKSAAAKAAGLSTKTIQLGDHEVSYNEGGTGQTLVLVHGFGANKDMWSQYAQRLVGEYHLIIPDLPGCGDSTFLDEENYGCLSQVANLKALVDALDLGPVHIAGNSMGGAIAGGFAATHPDTTRSLLLMNNAGMEMPDASDFQNALETGHNPLVVRSAADVGILFSYIFAKPPSLPPLVKHVLAWEAIQRLPQNEITFEHILAEGPFLTALLPQIKAPTLVMWGRLDRVLDVSIVQTLDKNLQGHKKVIYDDLGHCPAVERPGQSSQDHLSFLQST